MQNPPKLSNRKNKNPPTDWIPWALRIPSYDFPVFKTAATQGFHFPSMDDFVESFGRERLQCRT